VLLASRPRFAGTRGRRARGDDLRACRRGQRLDRIVAAPPADELRDDRGIERRAPVGHAPDRARELVDVGDPVLEHVADSLGVVCEQLERVVRLDVLGQHQHADVLVLRANRLRRGQSLVGVARRHADIDDPASTFGYASPTTEVSARINATSCSRPRNLRLELNARAS
jgi:hypothetical protein